MTRPIGARIIEACEIVERHGICSSPTVTPLMGIESTNAIKYLSRAVGYGLLTVSRDVRPHQYQVVAGWREKVKPIARVKPYTPRPPAPRVRTHHLQAVWSGGSDKSLKTSYSPYRAGAGSY